MKKLISASIILALSISYSSAQSVSKHSIQANLNPLYSFRSLTNYKDDTEQLKKFREDSDKYAFTFNAGLLYNYSITPKLSVSTGVGYTQYGIDLEGEMQIVTTDQPDGTGQTGNFEASLRYTYLDVPLYINYNFLTKPGFKLNVTIGAEYNLIQKAINSYKNTLNGKVLIERETDDLDEGSRNYNKENTTLVIGVGIEKAISNKVAISLQPNFRKQIESQYRTEYTAFEQRQFAFGCSINVKYSL